MVVKMVAGMVAGKGNNHRFPHRPQKSCPVEHSRPVASEHSSRLYRHVPTMGTRPLYREFRRFLPEPNPSSRASFPYYRSLLHHRSRYGCSNGPPSGSFHNGLHGLHGIIIIGSLDEIHEPVALHELGKVVRAHLREFLRGHTRLEPDLFQEYLSYHVRPEIVARWDAQSAYLPARPKYYPSSWFGPSFSLLEC